VQFRAYDTILSMANTFSCLNIHCVFSTKERVPINRPEPLLSAPICRKWAMFLSQAIYVLRPLQLAAS
jgi:hypothetical protein